MQYVYSAMPTFFGAFVVLGMFSIRSPREPLNSSPVAASMLLAGAGGILGNLLLALIIGVIDRAGLRVFTADLLVGMLAATALALMIVISLWYANSTVSCNRPKFSKIGFLFLAVVLILAVTTSYQAWIMPIAAWDALDHWVSWAHKFLAYDLSSDFFEERSRVNGDPWHWVHPRHPPTVFHSSAFTAYSSFTGSHAGWLSSWSYIWICSALVAGGFVRLVSGNDLITCLALYLYLTVPLFENQASLIGYADFWNLALVTSGCAYLAMYFLSRDMRYIVVGLALALSPLLIKNTGILYSIAVLLPFSFIFLKDRHPNSLFLILIICIASLIALKFIEIDFTFLGKRYSFLIEKNAIIRFGGYELYFSYYPILSILKNNFWSLFVNQSFSTSGLFLIFISSFIAITTSKVKTKKLSSESCYRSASIFILISSIGVILVFSLPQLIAEYSAAFAEPGSDIGNSRFIMSFATVGILVLGMLPHVISISGRWRE